MSRMTDVLKRASGSKDTAHLSIQEEIAKMYLRTSARPGGRGANGFRRYLPWAIATVAVIVAVVMFAFKSTIDIRVRILGEVPIVRTENAALRPAASEPGLYLLRGGEAEQDIVRHESFRGDARLFSEERSGELALANARGHGWANYEIELAEPVDLSRLDLKYAAKGDRGDEYLTVVIVDTANRVYRMGQGLSSKLAKEWRTCTVTFRPVGKAVDLANIAVIKFEFGSLTAGNYPRATLFLKDVYLTKQKRALWL